MSVLASYYHRSQLRLFVTQVPKSFRGTEEEAAIRSLFEQLPNSIDGIHAGLHWIPARERESQRVSQGKGLPSTKYGPHKQTPTLVYAERGDRWISKSLDKLLRHRGLASEDAEEELHLLIVEPTATAAKVVDSWLFKGVFPLHSGDIQLSSTELHALPGLKPASLQDATTFSVEMAYRSVLHRDPETDALAASYLAANNA